MRGTVGTQLSIHERLTRALPDMWDWEPVKWSGWTDDVISSSSAVWHWPIEALACHECGVIGKNRFATGIRPTRHDLGETRPIRSLHAMRCADCGHDVVVDQRTEESWDLDDTDYGIAGSVRPEHAHTTDLTEQPEPTTLF